jgi:hypothetical protein
VIPQCTCARDDTHSRPRTDSSRPCPPSSPQRNGVCICADYTLQANGTISVLNQMRTGTPEGQFGSIRGVAEVDGSGIPGHLQVKLGKMPFWGAYWISVTGPVVDGKYEYVIVTDKLQITMSARGDSRGARAEASAGVYSQSRHSRESCGIVHVCTLSHRWMLSLFDALLSTARRWVLVRDLDTYFKLYDAEVQPQLASFGFTHFWNSPLRTMQTNCTYQAEDSELTYTNDIIDRDE